MQEKRPKMKDARNSRFGLSILVEFHKSDGFCVNVQVSGAGKAFWTSRAFTRIFKVTKLTKCLYHSSRVAKDT